MSEKSGIARKFENIGEMSGKCQEILILSQNVNKMSGIFNPLYIECLITFSPLCNSQFSKQHTCHDLTTVILNFI